MGMGRRDRTGRRLGTVAGLLAAVVLSAPAVTSGGGASAAIAGPLADPPASVSPSPDYPDICAPVGIDDTRPCLQVTLDAIDRARTAEGVGPLSLPADFPQLSLSEQLFIVVDRERVDRGLAPFTELSADLTTQDARAAALGQLPPDPGVDYPNAYTEYLGGVINTLDADFEWLYDDGPGVGLAHCGRDGGSGCWTDRHTVLARYGGGGPLVMGVGVDPTGDRSPGDVGGPALAATFAVGPPDPGPVLYTWAEAQAAMASGSLRPLRAVPADESATGIPDPTHNVAPDYLNSCRPSGIDSSARCIDAVLADIDLARRHEGVRPMLLPTDFDQLSVPEQIFVAIDRERVDRGLAPFVGMVTYLNDNAQMGADRANDPPNTDDAYSLVDGEWAGGAANGLDAVFGWMYDDGANSGNLDCPHVGAPGCWGHRQGILDDFGSGPDLVMGAAVNPTGDTTSGDRGGTSMAATLADSVTPATRFTYRWTQALADMPTGPAEP